MPMDEPKGLQGLQDLPGLRPLVPEVQCAEELLEVCFAAVTVVIAAARVRNPVRCRPSSIGEPIGPGLLLHHQDASCLAFARWRATGCLCLAGAGQGLHDDVANCL